MIKQIIENLKDKTRDEVMEYLRSNNTLTPYQKNIVWVWLFPVNIGDYELPKIIMNNRGQDHQVGYLEPNETEILTLLRAYRVKQYNRFMRHLLHATLKNPDKIYVAEETTIGEDECVVCRKPILSYNDWKENYPTDTKKEYLSFSGDNTPFHFCMNCLLQLNELHNLLKSIEGDDYLTKWERH